jgi:DNA-binding response OmpR family regulator
VVDDDTAVRASLAEVLEDADYEVSALADGNAALLYLCQNEPPSVVLVDLLLPGLNAWELIAEMRRRERLAAVPVLVMTGAPASHTASLPGYRTLQKPLSPQALLAAIRAALPDTPPQSAR